MTTRELVPVRLPPDPPFPTSALAAALDGTGPAVLVLPPGAEGDRLAEALLPLARDGVPADTAVVVTTSGSTGEPKGVRIGADALRFAERATHDHLGGPGQWLLAMSPARIAGFAVLVRSRAAGGEPVALGAGRFEPARFAAALARLDPDRRRYAALVPTQLARLLDAEVALDRLEAILLGGGPIPAGLVTRAAARGVRVVRTYGMTETCGGCVYDGRPLPGVQLMIGVGGLIGIAGPVLARGYLGSAPAGGPPGTTPGFTGGWFTSSDLGRIDADGVLHVLGRADDVIVSGGVNVAAQAVEAVLAEHAAVAEVAVVGRNDPEWGRRVVAVLVSHGREPDPSELRGLVSARLGGAHAPREFVLVAELPRLPSGKVDRAAVRALVEPDGPAPGGGTGD